MVPFVLFVALCVPSALAGKYEALGCEFPAAADYKKHCQYAEWIARATQRDAKSAAAAEGAFKQLIEVMVNPALKDRTSRMGALTGVNGDFFKFFQTLMKVEKDKNALWSGAGAQKYAASKGFFTLEGSISSQVGEGVDGDPAIMLAPPSLGKDRAAKWEISGAFWNALSYIYASLLTGKVHVFQSIYSPDSVFKQTEQPAIVQKKLGVTFAFHPLGPGPGQKKTPAERVERSCVADGKFEVDKNGAQTSVSIDMTEQEAATVLHKMGAACIDNDKKIQMAPESPPVIKFRSHRFSKLVMFTRMILQPPKDSLEDYLSEA